MFKNNQLKDKRIRYLLRTNKQVAPVVWNRVKYACVCVWQWHTHCCVLWNYPSTNKKMKFFEQLISVNIFHPFLVWNFRLNYMIGKSKWVSEKIRTWLAFELVFGDTNLIISNRKMINFYQMNTFYSLMIYVFIWLSSSYWSTQCTRRVLICKFIIIIIISIIIIILISKQKEEW